MEYKDYGKNIKDDMAAKDSGADVYEKIGDSQEQFEHQGGRHVAPQQKPRGRMAVMVCAGVAVVLLAGASIWYFVLRDKSEPEWTDENFAAMESAAERMEPEYADDVATSQVSQVQPEADEPYDYTAMVCYRRLTSLDLKGCPKAELRIMLNTIYARHGYVFEDGDLKSYFSRYRWYSPRTNRLPDKELSPMERDNVALIKSQN